MINFYMTPGSCSTGIHILLEELEIVFSANLVNLMAGDQYKPEFIAINPKSTIPVLVLNDGTALTSFQGIAWWLSAAHPKAGLLPDNIADQAKALDLLGYVVNQIHGTGFTRIFTPEIYCEEEILSDARKQLIQKKGEDIVSKGFETVTAFLDHNGEYLAQQFTIVDAALFYVEFWADKTEMYLPPKCRAHYERTKQRAAVLQVLAEEGYRY
jgi:glutathione S-transferase